MASYGRKVEKAGLKLLFIFPYAFVVHPRRGSSRGAGGSRSPAAGPVSDFSVGAVFSPCCQLPDGTVRDIFFNLAFAAYVGAFFNLNPFIDRDGYQMLVDVLKELGCGAARRSSSPARSRARAATRPTSVLARYSFFGLAWSFLAAFFAIGMTLRYKPIMDNFAPDYVVWAVLIYALGRLLHPGLHRPREAARRSGARE